MIVRLGEEQSTTSRCLGTARSCRSARPSDRRGMLGNMARAPVLRLQRSALIGEWERRSRSGVMAVLRRQVADGVAGIRAMELAAKPAGTTGDLPLALSQTSSRVDRLEISVP